MVICLQFFMLINILPDLSRAPVFDMSELETLFSAALPKDARGSDKSGSRASGPKPEKIHLVSCFSK